ncbi:MAG TPA: DsbA family protein [Aliicoccus persicus]|uniref:DsbA family protein n=1 Tax=Aliicoccus persicus TaxID=930138 RepID=A0A921B5X0_9STAP|nr:DsbA family protein [Aliicoccus persicus]
MKIEFVHDVICSFCFPMSHRMRKIDEKYNNVEITHRSFALGWDVSNFEGMFGSHEAVKPEVLGHWEQANQNDDLSRFNIEGMREKDFLFPTSKFPLIAAKAAGLLGGEKSYWEVFDALQHALFVDNKDIADTSVIEAVIRDTSLDFEQWKKRFEDPKTEQAVQEDLDFVKKNGINSVPALIVEDKYLINGAQPQEVIEKTLEEIAEKENLQLNTGFQMIGGDGEACRMEDGQWKCD